MQIISIYIFYKHKTKKGIYYHIIFDIIMLEYLYKNKQGGKSMEKLDAEKMIKIAERWEQMKRDEPEKYGNLDMIPLDVMRKLREEIEE